MTDAISRLRKLAEEATPGPWSFGGCEKHPEEYNSTCWVVRSSAGTIVAHDRKNRAYEAAANPAVVLALLDLVEAADRMRRAGTYVPPEYGTGPTEEAAEYDTARSALEKVGMG